MLFFFLPLLGAEENAAADPASLIGITLDDLLRRFGTPRSVHAVRGIEAWQDDVVFVYPHGNMYIHRDRVWKIRIPSARGISLGDSRAVVSLILDSRAETRGTSIFYPINEFAWPLMLRLDFDAANRVEAIFIHRIHF